MVHLSDRRTGLSLLVTALVLTGCASEKKFSPVGLDLSPEVTATTLPALVTNTGDGFTISLPSQGTLKKETVASGAGALEMTYLTASSGIDNHYTVGYFAAPASGFDLEAAAQGVATSAEGKVAELGKVTYKGHDGRDFRVSQAKGKATVFGRVMKVKKRIFIVQAVIIGDVPTMPPTYIQILESLTFT